MLDPRQFDLHIDRAFKLQTNGTLRESTLDVEVNITQSTLHNLHYIVHTRATPMVFTYTIGLNALELMDLAYK